MARKTATIRITPAAAEADQIEEQMTRKQPRKPPIPDEDWLSSGCTMLNLGVSKRPDGCIAKGMFLYFVGDSSSGKTWFAMQFLAEAVRNPNFADYRYVFDNAENGAYMDVARYYGRRVRKRLEPPRGTRADPIFSETVQQLYRNIRAACQAGPCIYILDSMDALHDDTEEKKFEADADAAEAGEKVKGTYGMDKAKTNARNINRVTRILRKTGSILILISQAKDDIGSPIPGAKRFSGGKSLKFFAHCQVWTSIKGDIKEDVLDLERIVGKTLMLDIQKNRVSGQDCKVQIPFYPEHGLDETGSMVDFLAAEGVFPSSASKWNRIGPAPGKVKAEPFGLTCNREKLVAHIEEDDDRVRRLREIVAERWAAIAAASRPLRKPRYE